MENKMSNREIESCFIYYKYFNIDFISLVNAGVLQYIGNNRYEWKRKKTSLAEYFDFLGPNDLSIPGGFWRPVSEAFTIKGKPTTQKQLSGVIYRQKNSRKPKSDDFLEIKKIVEKHRTEVKKTEEAHKHLEYCLNSIHKIIHDYFNMPQNKQKSPETMNDLIDRLGGEFKKIDKNI
jgi:hypothetical protein